MQVTGLRCPSAFADVRVSPPEFAYILPTRWAAGAACREQRSGGQRRRPTLRARSRGVGFRPLGFRRSPRTCPRPRWAGAHGIQACCSYILLTRSVGTHLPVVAIGCRVRQMRHHDLDCRLLSSGLLRLACLHLYVEAQRSRRQHPSRRVGRRRCCRRPRRRPDLHGWGGASWRG